MPGCSAAGRRAAEYSNQKIAVPRLNDASIDALCDLDAGARSAGLGRRVRRIRGSRSSSLSNEPGGQADEFPIETPGFPPAFRQELTGSASAGAEFGEQS